MGTIEKINLEREIRDAEKAHKEKLTPKKGLSDMMKQGRFDNIKN